MLKSIWNAYLSWRGWDTHVRFPHEEIRQFILIVAPHTTNWDFIVGIGYRSILGLSNVRFLGKKELFRPPLGAWFRWLGGIPVDRKKNHDMVKEVAGFFRQYDDFRLALSPEGSRSKVDRLRTGFYFIAKEAKVSIIMAGLDWKNKTVKFSAPLFPTDQEKDFKTILDFFRGVEGKYPENGLG